MNNKIILGMVVVILVIGGGWYAYTQFNSTGTGQSANQIPYGCTGGVAFGMTMTPNFASLHISAIDGSTYPPSTTLTRVDPGNSAGVRYESKGITLTGTGETVALGEGTSTVSCFPILSGGMVATNFGAPEVDSGTNNEPIISGEYLGGTLLLGFNETSAVGKYLIGFGGGLNGTTLYSYSKDKNGVSACTGACAVNWPPYTITDKRALTIIEAGVPGQVGTITRADGTLQVTYNGKPLYFYKNDMNPGDTNGQGVGGVWSVVVP